MPYTYEYPRPALTVDCVAFAYEGEQLQVLLIQRDREPFAGHWALPGGFVEMEETLDQAVLRELEEETGVSGIEVEQLHTFGALGRDPRGRTVSVVYYSLIDKSVHPVQGADDAREARWFPVDDLPPLAFDHSEIVAMALARVRANRR